MNITSVGILVFFVAFGFFINNAFAQVDENSAYLLEGSGYAVTEESIKLSEIDFGVSSNIQSGSSINFLIEDGFITLDNEDFSISNVDGKFLRDGRYIRINGNAENQDGSNITISFFGRLVEKSKDAAIYGFTGRISTLEDSYKIVYTSKLSKLTKISEAASEPGIAENTIKIRILPGASSQGVLSSYIESGQKTGIETNQGDPSRLGYFSEDRITIEPGTTITLVNDDSVTHKIISGKENYNDRYNPFTPDGRISSPEILPGKSATITFNEMGFYRLYDPSYPWMKIIVYSFPNVDNIILGPTKNQQGN